MTLVEPDTSESGSSSTCSGAFGSGDTLVVRGALPKRAAPKTLLLALPDQSTEVGRRLIIADHRLDRRHDRSQEKSAALPDRAGGVHRSAGSAGGVVPERIPRRLLKRRRGVPRADSVSSVHPGPNMGRRHIRSEFRRARSVNARAVETAIVYTTVQVTISKSEPRMPSSDIRSFRSGTLPATSRDSFPHLWRHRVTAPAHTAAGLRAGQ